MPYLTDLWDKSGVGTIDDQIQAYVMNGVLYFLSPFLVVSLRKRVFKYSGWPEESDMIGVKNFAFLMLCSVIMRPPYCLLIDASFFMVL